MSNVIDFCPPLENFYTPGCYTQNDSLSPSFTMRLQKNLSICEIIPFSSDNKNFLLELKNVLGLVVPDTNYAHIAGTRTILCPRKNLLFVITEGEARNVLTGRLQYKLKEDVAVFDKSAAYAVLRIDGYQFYDIFKNIIQTVDKLVEKNNYCTIISIDSYKVVLHRQDEATHFIYTPRSIAPNFYKRIARICYQYGIKLI